MWLVTRVVWGREESDDENSRRGEANLRLPVHWAPGSLLLLLLLLLLWSLRIGVEAGEREGARQKDKCRRLLVVRCCRERVDLTLLLPPPSRRDERDIRGRGVLLLTLLEEKGLIVKDSPIGKMWLRVKSKRARRQEGRSILQSEDCKVISDFNHCWSEGCQAVWNCCFC